VGESTTQALAVASLFSVLAMQTLQVGGQNFAPQNSAKELVETARATFGKFDPDAPFYSLHTYDQTLPLLLGRTITLVAYTDELALGLRMEPLKGIQTIGEFDERWRKNTRGYAVMPTRVYEEEAASGLPMHFMARNARVVLVRR